MRRTGELIVRTLRERDDEAALAAVRAEVKEICARFPVPGLPDA
jgi:glycine/serine hydroxymethyltransferase